MLITNHLGRDCCRSNSVWCYVTYLPVSDMGDQGAKQGEGVRGGDIGGGGHVAWHGGWGDGGMGGWHVTW